MPATHRSVFTGRMPFLRPTNSVKALNGFVTDDLVIKVLGYSSTGAYWKREATFVVNEEVRRAVYDVLVSEDDVEPVRRGGHDERHSLPAATHRHVGLIGRR